MEVVLSLPGSGKHERTECASRAAFTALEDRQQLRGSLGLETLSSPARNGDADSSVSGLTTQSVALAAGASRLRRESYAGRSNMAARSRSRSSAARPPC